MATQALEAMASALEASGNYKVLRRLDVDRDFGKRIVSGPVRFGCIVDVETTGLDAGRDEIIQLAILPFRYTVEPDAHVIDVLPVFNRDRQPTKPISRAVTELTGIDATTVAGKRIDTHEVEDFMAQYDIDLVVAHNAKFDREFVVRAYGKCFATRRWACSLSQIPWETEAMRGRGLPFLAMQAGWFCRSHDASEDCRALLALLDYSLPVTGRTPLSYLVAASLKELAVAPHPFSMPEYRVRALGAPFDRKDAVKARGYRWCPGTDGQPKAWFIDVAAEKRADEVSFLEREILKGRSRAVVESLSSSG